MKDKNELILNGPISITLIRITIPSVIGMLGMMIFNIVDTYFVGKLGSVELAAISFTFPVVMVINSLVFGIGTAAMALFSRAVGNKNFEKERLLATSTLTLGVSISIITGVIGFFTIEPLFRALGADDELIPLIISYMSVWYLGAGFMVIPMLGDSILRGLGDTNTPALVMLITAAVNVVLDPLMIFGIGPFPEMGIKGAAIATIISRGISALVSVLIQIFRENLITIRGMAFKKSWEYWKALLHIGLPNSLVKAITPLGTAIFTSILATYGHEVVAGYGVAIKIESVFLALVNAFAITATVFVGQNLGAHNFRRAKRGIRTINIYLMGLGLLSAVLLFFSGNFLASLFNEDIIVRSTTAVYLMIVPIGYGFMGQIQIGVSILNVFHKPFFAAGFSLVQIGIVAIPAAYILSALLGVNGVFFAILASFVLTGFLSFIVVGKQSAIHLPEAESPVPQ